MICANCGHHLEEGRLFCGNCGHLNSQNSQEQKSIKALEFTKTNKYDLFTLGWCALISFALARHFVFLPEIAWSDGSYFAPMGIPVPVIGNNFGSNFSFAVIILLNIISVIFASSNNNKLNKNISGIFGVLLILISPVTLIVGYLLDMPELFFLPLLIISETLFYLGINVIVISKTNYKEPQFIISTVFGIVIGIFASLILTIVLYKFSSLAGLGKIAVNSFMLILLAVYAFTKHSHDYKETVNSAISVKNTKPLFIALFFAPLFANLLVGYLLYMLYYS